MKQMLTRPAVTEEILEQIRQTIAENPDWGRTRISMHLCELWDWRVPGGTLKDVSCRDMLRALDKAGRIPLPAPRNTSAQSPRRKLLPKVHDTQPIICGLDALQPLSIQVVERGEELATFKSLLAQYHYLAFDRTTGENMKYVIRSKNGAILACLLFGSAAWSCRDRDAYIGWNREQRVANLHRLANNSRFLIVPWCKVPNLASHALSLVARRIGTDWEAKYGHPLFALETFVEFRRFRGVSYQAANWVRVGRTRGRGRNDRRNEWALPEKDIYLLPLSRRWREALLTE
jgi:hypothetical protein